MGEVSKSLSLEGLSLTHPTALRGYSVRREGCALTYSVSKDYSMKASWPASSVHVTLTW